MLSFRLAVPDDAEEACTVLRRSIEDLCSLDHGNDPMVLERWLSNKTPDIVEEWIQGNPNGMFVAILDGGIAGVGLIRGDGYILLNYVAPWARFQGVSVGLMRVMEHRAATTGKTECRLKSTTTARTFYHRYGYEDDGDPVPSFGATPAYPMRRSIVAAAFDDMV